jgi:nucleoside-diphosphate-sugar epimerase
MTQRVLITGAAGFVGSHTARYFVQQGWQVIGYDLAKSGGILNNDVTCIFGDILDQKALESAVTQYDVSGIVHLAATVREPGCLDNPGPAVQVNVVGTTHVLELARKHNLRVTYLSTATLYGRDPDLHPLSEDSPVSPVGIYDTTKYMAEALCMTYHKVFGTDVTAVRTGFVYGPGQGIDRYFVEHVSQGIALSEHEGADHPCDYTYVKDLAKGLFLAHSVRPIQHRLFNITGGHLYRRQDLVKIVKDAFPDAQIHLGKGINEKLNLRGVCLIDRARQELGYEPLSLEAGVADWVRELQVAQ